MCVCVSMSMSMSMSMHVCMHVCMHARMHTCMHTHTHTHTHTRRVRICPELPQAGGPRVDADPTSFAETEESAEQEADDPTIQCQTICKFVRPTVAPTAD